MSGESYTHIGQLSSDGNWRWDGASWRPVVPRTLPRWLNRDTKGKATWLTLVAALAGGLVADQALRTGTFGLAASLTMALIALALVFAGRIASLESRALVGASIVLGPGGRAHGCSGPPMSFAPASVVSCSSTSASPKRGPFGDALCMS